MLAFHRTKKTFDKVIFLMSIGLFILLFSIFLPEKAKAFTQATYCPHNWIESTEFSPLDIPFYCCELVEPLHTRGSYSCPGGGRGWETRIEALWCPKDTLLTCPGAVNAAHRRCFRKDEVIRGGGGLCQPAKEGQFFLGCVDGKTIQRDLEFDSVGSIDTGFCYDGDAGSAVYSNTLNVCVCKDRINDPQTRADLGETLCRDFCRSVDNIFFNGVDRSGGSGDFVALGCNDPKTGVPDPQCEECQNKGNVYTALGCIDASQDGIIVWVIRIGIGMIIAISIVRFIQAAMLLQKADPESVQEGRDVITSAIIALVLALLAVPLLSFIGVNILGIFPADFL